MFTKLYIFGANFPSLFHDSSSKIMLPLMRQNNCYQVFCSRRRKQKKNRWCTLIQQIIENYNRYGVQVMMISYGPTSTPSSDDSQLQGSLCFNCAPAEKSESYEDHSTMATVRVYYFPGNRNGSRRKKSRWKWPTFFSSTFFRFYFASRLAEPGRCSFRVRGIGYRSAANRYETDLAGVQIAMHRTPPECCGLVTVPRIRSSVFVFFSLRCSSGTTRVEKFPGKRCCRVEENVRCIEE